MIMYSSNPLACGTPGGDGFSGILSSTTVVLSWLFSALCKYFGQGDSELMSASVVLSE
jgi:hypothetical protein